MDVVEIDNESVGAMARLTRPTSLLLQQPLSSLGAAQKRFPSEVQAPASTVIT